MGEGSDRLTLDGLSRRDRVRHVSGEIESLRGHLGSLVAELDRRRVEAMDVGLQLRRHPTFAAVAAIGAALLVGGAVAFAVRRQRKRHELRRRAREVRRAFGAIVKDPYNVAKDSSLTEKLVATAGTTVMTLLVKRLVDQYLPAGGVAPARAGRDGAPRITVARGGIG